MTLLRACTAEATEALPCLYDMPGIKEWASECLVGCQRSSVRREAAKGLLNLSVATPHAGFTLVREEGGGVLHPHCWLLELLLPLACEVVPPCDTCAELFMMLGNLFQQTKRLCVVFAEASTEGVTWEGLMQRAFGGLLDGCADVLLRRLRERPVLEERGKTWEDLVLQGTLTTLCFIFTLRPELKLVYIREEHRLISFLFNDCLFESPTLDTHAPNGPPKCKTPGSRKQCFKVLSELANNCPRAYAALLREMECLHAKRELRPLHLYQPSLLDRAPCGFVGLRNLGATCYMNSLLQQLYHVPEFRAQILKVPVQEENKAEDVMYQVQALFVYLQESEKQFYETRDLCLAYKGYDGQPVNTSQQMDVDEYFNMLFEKLETCVKGTEQERVLQECFGGKVVNQIICKDLV
eukprot:CAMPEP_0206235924 /NCGR_PEP_ID=MMETSP0047_2-20121206/13427_1 /ASSEMBLY_ACC=CAM_ASM_000192 /TAXON_ID=195065 /ORGANISM="Chroomonas mesostigmatica_cf, Strain CCMP1168" /LENGTH=408 /DNA_ID=CAMNT_0053660197 /DNA_START=21 /DNA_END=1244 /DNA_ORIENTATION=-